MDRQRHLNNDAEIKRLELIYAQRDAVEAKASHWLKTKSGPPVLWLPLAHDATTHRMLEDRHGEYEAWKVGGAAPQGVLTAYKLVQRAIA